MPGNLILLKVTFALSCECLCLFGFFSVQVFKSCNWQDSYHAQSWHTKNKYYSLNIFFNISLFSQKIVRNIDKCDLATSDCKNKPIKGQATISKSNQRNKQLNKPFLIGRTLQQVNLERHRAESRTSYRSGQGHEDTPTGRSSGDKQWGTFL